MLAQPGSKCTEHIPGLKNPGLSTPGSRVEGLGPDSISIGGPHAPTAPVTTIGEPSNMVKATEAVLLLPESSRIWKFSPPVSTQLLSSGLPQVLFEAFLVQQIALTSIGYF